MRTTSLAFALIAFAVSSTGCSSVTSVPADGGSADGGAGDGASVDDGSADTGFPLDGPIGGDRPVAVHVPPGYADGTPAPLVVMLHGYTATAAAEEQYLKLKAQSDSRGFIYAMPDGTEDAMGQFWNATDACCDVTGTMVDDSTYLSKVITQLKAKYTIDPKKVFIFGHSNGGFMAYRMACDHGDQIAAIVSFAGAMYNDVTLCAAQQPVSILEIHGTADTIISYSGGSFMGHAYPGAVKTVNDWVTINGCSTTGDTSSPPLDLVSNLAGNETTVTKYETGCMPGGGAELWTVAGGGHIPALSATFTTDAMDFLYAHPKP